MTRPVAAILLGRCASPALLERMSRATDAGIAPTPEPVPAALVALVKRLTAAGIAVTLVEDLEEAKVVAALRDRPARLMEGESPPGMDDSGMAGGAPATVTPILIDLSRSSSDDPEDLELARRILGDCRQAFGGQGPIAITAGAPPRLLLECFRAGAADVIDLTHEGTTRARAAVARACDVEQLRRAEAEVTREQRELLDELVRDLVRTERRTIELEQRIDQARQAQQASAPAAPAHDERLYLERIRSRHAALLARYLGLKSAAPRDD